MNRLTGFLVAVVMGFCVGLTQAETIYQHDFAGLDTDPLNGVGVEGGTGIGTPWVAEDAWFADGHAAVGASDVDNANAFLPFVPSSGKQYTLSATLTATGDTFNFMTLSFMNNPTVDTFSTNVGGPWMFKRAQQSGFVDEVYSATNNLDGLVNHGPFAGAVELAMVLNTELPQWTVEYLVNGASVRGPEIFGTNPTITHVGVTRYVEPVTGTASGFRLSVVPEPAALGLVLSGLAGLFGCRRR